MLPAAYSLPVPFPDRAYSYPSDVSGEPGTPTPSPPPRRHRRTRTYSTVEDEVVSLDAFAHLPWMLLRLHLNAASEARPSNSEPNTLATPQIAEPVDPTATAMHGTPGGWCQGAPLRSSMLGAGPVAPLGGLLSLLGRTQFEGMDEEVHFTKAHSQAAHRQTQTQNTRTPTHPILASTHPVFIFLGATFN